MANRQAILVAMGILMAILSITAVGLRLLARRTRKMRLGADDYTVLAALIFVLALCADSLVAAFMGKLGVHGRKGPHGLLGTSDDPMTSFRQLVVRDKTIWVEQWLAALGPGLTKLSVLLFYKRIFVGKVFNITNWTLLVLSASWTIGGFFSNFLDCIPIQANWAIENASNYSKESAKKSVCVQIVPLFWSLTISDIILDALILMLPWYPVWNLQMPVRQKISVCGIFLLGAFVVATGIVRITAVQQALADNPDHSYTRSSIFYWNTIEAGTGVVSACLPTMKPLFSRPGAESIIRSLQRRIKNSLSRTRLTEHNSNFMRASSTDDTSRASVIHGNKSKGGDAYHASIEAMHMEDFSPPPNGIAVLSSFIQQENMV